MTSQSSSETNHRSPERVPEFKQDLDQLTEVGGQIETLLKEPGFDTDPQMKAAAGEALDMAGIIKQAVAKARTERLNARSRELLRLAPVLVPILLLIFFALINPGTVSAEEVFGEFENIDKIVLEAGDDLDAPQSVGRDIEDVDRQEGPPGGYAPVTLAHISEVVAQRIFELENFPGVEKLTVGEGTGYQSFALPLTSPDQAIPLIDLMPDNLQRLVRATHEAVYGKSSLLFVYSEISRDLTMVLQLDEDVEMGGHTYPEDTILSVHAERGEAITLQNDQSETTPIILVLDQEIKDRISNSLTDNVYRNAF